MHAWAVAHAVIAHSCVSIVVSRTFTHLRALRSIKRIHSSQHRSPNTRYLTTPMDEGSAWLITTTPPAPRPAPCVISKIYDQTHYHNDLGIGPAGGNGGKDLPVNAEKYSLSVGGHKVYGAYFEGGMGCKCVVVRHSHHT